MPTRMFLATLVALSSALSPVIVASPSVAASLRTWKRVSGTVWSSRSMTCTPLRFRPAMNARLSARAVRLVSRLVQTTAPFLSAVP